MGLLLLKFGFDVRLKFLFLKGLCSIKVIFKYDFWLLWCNRLYNLIIDIICEFKYCRYLFGNFSVSIDEILIGFYKIILGDKKIFI